MKLRFSSKTSILIFAGMAAATIVMLSTRAGSERYVSASPAVSQKFLAVPSERALLDLCIRFRRIDGVTGVSYRDFSSQTHSAVVTIFYDPARTTPRQIRTFVQHTNVLWDKLLNA